MEFDAVTFLEGLFARSSGAAISAREAAASAVESIGPEDLPGDWRVEWEERAAIREFDGGQPREHAELDALREIIQRMRASGESP